MMQQQTQNKQKIKIVTALYEVLKFKAFYVQQRKSLCFSARRVRKPQEKKAA